MSSDALLLRLWSCNRMGHPRSAPHRPLPQRCLPGYKGPDSQTPWPRGAASRIPRRPTGTQIHRLRRRLALTPWSSMGAGGCCSPPAPAPAPGRVRRGLPGPCTRKRPGTACTARYPNGIASFDEDPVAAHAVVSVVIGRGDVVALRYLGKAPIYSKGEPIGKIAPRRHEPATLRGQRMLIRWGADPRTTFDPYIRSCRLQRDTHFSTGN